jgi:Family of unknown function (DUF6263)
MKPMKAFLMFVLLCFLSAAPELRAQSKTADDDYFDVYSLITKADQLAEKGKTGAAMTNYITARKELKQFQQDNPLWNPKLVKYRLGYLDETITAETSSSPAHKSPGTTPSSHSPSANTQDAGPPVDLKVKWQVGKRYNQEINMTMDSTVKVPGQAESMKQQSTVQQDFSISAVKGLDGGGSALDMQITRMKMSMGMGGQTMSIDSMNPGDTGANPAAAIFQKLIGLHIKMQTDARGQVQSVENLKDLVAATGGADAAAASALKGFLTEDSLKQMASVEGLPDHPVKVGDSWPFKLDMPQAMVGNLAVDMNITFSGWEQKDDHKCAALMISGTISMKPPDSGGEPVMSLDGGNVNGELWFDPDLGMPIESSATENFTLKVNAQGQSLTTEMKEDIGAKLLTVDDIAVQ